VKIPEILIVDDTDTNIEILSELLGDEYEVMATLDGEFALEIANDDMPDLILLDIMMPVMDGYEVCKRLKENPKTKNIPVIFITAKTDEESIEKAYDVGGIDYVTKPFKPKELLARVKTQLELRKLIHDLEVSHSELQLLASTDPMTKLYNRRYFTEVSKNIFDLAKRNRTKLSAVIIDIDKFKNINDTYGHKVGDDVIIELALLLKELNRQSDIVSRWGGEEFVILLPDTDIDGAMIIAHRLREKVETLVVEINSELSLQFTISIGVSQVDTDNDIDVEASVVRADKALYKAKNSGRNRVCLTRLSNE